jgi:hypothetical protein
VPGIRPRVSGRIDRSGAAVTPGLPLQCPADCERADGVVIVAGADARHGRSRSLVITRVHTEDGTELAAADYFRTMGGYLS